LALPQFDISDDAFARGVSAAIWPGRLQPITSGPLKALAQNAELWVDGGHNPHAARALAHALSEMNKKRPARCALIVGLRARKDWRGFIETLAPLAALAIAVPLASESASPEAVAHAARRAGAEAATAPDVANAIGAALANGAERILICGSLLLAGEALRLSG